MHLSLRLGYTLPNDLKILQVRIAILPRANHIDIQKLFQFSEIPNLEMLNPLNSFKRIFDRIKQRISLITAKEKIPSLISIEQKLFSLLKIIIFLSAISFIIVIVFNIFNEDERIVVQPFEISGFDKNLDGKDLAILLCFDLQKIIKTYEQAPNIANSNNELVIERPLGDFRISDLNITAPLEYNLPSIGAIGVGGTTISMDNLILYFKDFFGNKPDVITCSLQRYNSSMAVVSILENGKSSKRNILIFADEAKIPKEEQIPTLIDNLAFMILLDIIKQESQENNDLYPQTWQAFSYITKGRNAYNNYVNKKNTNNIIKISYLNDSRKMALLAIDFEPGYKKTYDLLLGLGFAYLEVDGYNESEDIFENISCIKPFESKLGLGIAYNLQRHYIDAQNALDNAIQLNGTNADAWYFKGVVLYNQKNYNESIEAYERAIEFDNKHYEAWNGKGNALLYLNKLDEAIEAYNESIKSNFNYSNAWYNKGLALYGLNRYDEAIDACDKSIELDPNYSNTWEIKAMALYHQGKKDEANIIMNKADYLDIISKCAN